MKPIQSVVVLSVVVLASALMGCGSDKNDCEEASDRAAAKYAQCNVPFENVLMNVECTAELAQLAQRSADCLDDAPCGAIDDTDAAAAEALATCRGGGS